jgi:LPXTG-site transpeptidase (sortase) family protein
MKLVKFLAQFILVFVVIFGIYALIYHFQVKSNPKVELFNTFVASDKEITSIAEEDGKEYGDSTNLNESNIDKEGFYIRIDKIDLFKPVVTNVDPRYKDEYVASWETGVSHGKFTALPDQIGNVYLFSHAVSKEDRIESDNAWFTKIDLLVENDEVIIYYQGKKYIYQVSKIYTVSPTSTGVYTGVSPVPKVTLQTCGPPRGSISSRYMVEGLQVSVTEL